MKKKLASPDDIAEMSLTQLTDLRKNSELRNLIYHYNISRDQDTEPCVYVYWGGNILHPDGGYKYSVYFEKRGDTDADTPPVVRFTTLTEVRSFIIALIALRKIRP